MPWVPVSAEEAKAAGVWSPEGSALPDAAPQPSLGEAMGRGFAQGVTLRGAPQMSGSFAAGQKQLERMPELKGVPDADLYALGMASNDDYTQNRDAHVAGNAAAKAAHPLPYLGSEMAGGAIPAAALASTGVGAVGTGMTLGGISGLQGSAADLTKGEWGQAANDAAMGTAVGGAAGYAGSNLGPLLRGGGTALTAMGNRSGNLGQLLGAGLAGSGKLGSAVTSFAAPHAARLAGNAMSRLGGGIGLPGQVAAAGNNIAGQAASGAARAIPDAGNVDAAKPTAAEAIRQTVEQNPAALGPYGPLLQQALSKGEQSFNANLFTLSQTDPKFQEGMRQLSEKIDEGE